jgi:hypothetical protein
MKKLSNKSQQNLMNYSNIFHIMYDELFTDVTYDPAGHTKTMLTKIKLEDEPPKKMGFIYCAHFTLSHSNKI